MTNEETQKEREELLEGARKAQAFANECLEEVVVYRRLLEDIYEAAKEASQNGDLKSFLITVLEMHHCVIPNDNDVKQWGKDFVYAYSRDASWLKMAKESLEKIMTDVEKLSAEENTPDAKLKESILEAAREGLIPHI